MLIIVLLFIADWLMEFHSKGIYTLTWEKLTLLTSAFSSEEVNLSANAIVCFHTPTNPDDAPFQIIFLNKEVANFNFTQAYDLQLTLTSNRRLLLLNTPRIFYFLV